VFKLSLRLKLIMAALLTCVVLALVFGYTLWALHLPSISSPDRAHTKASPPLTNIAIPKAQDLFVPFLLVVPLHATVTWRNGDLVAHVVTTTAQQSHFLNPQAFSFRVSAGSQVQFTFSRVGLYHYYDTTMSTWNATFSRVAAHRGTPHFPIAMDGVIWVQGPISDLPTAGINPILAGHDEFTSEFLAISHPGGVTWHNFDGDAHFVGLVAGWSTPINPVDIGLYRIAGTNDVPGGATVTVLFETPGLYYYYCRNHDLVDPHTHRAQALPKASEYPIPMEGFVLVVGS
jgi:plastocyanin